MASSSPWALWAALLGLIVVVTSLNAYKERQSENEVVETVAQLVGQAYPQLPLPKRKPFARLLVKACNGPQ